MTHLNLSVSCSKNNDGREHHLNFGSFFVSDTLIGDQEKGIDKYFFLLLSIVDENQSWYINDTMAAYTDCAQVNTSDPDFQNSNLIPCKVKRNILY